MVRTSQARVGREAYPELRAGIEGLIGAGFGVR